MKMSHRWSNRFLLLTVAAATGLYTLTLNPARLGAYHDDGIYAVTAKALAIGQGYLILSLPGEPAQTKYPPLYPFLLSLVWRAWPVFPQNVGAMLGLSVGLAGLFLLASYGYLVRRGYTDRWTAWLIVVLMAFNWRIVFLAGGLFSDALYMALSVLALWVSERACAEGRLRWASLAGALLGLVFLTRTIGVALLAAVVLYFLIKRRYRALAVVLLTSAFFIVPWLIWQRAHPVSTADPVAVYYLDYVADFRAHMADWRLIPNILARNIFYLALVFIPSVSLSIDFKDAQFMDSRWVPLFLFSFLFGFAFILLGFIRRWVSGARLADIYMVIYLSVLVIWPYNASHDRFLLPLLPFLLLYMIAQAKRFVSARSPTPYAGRARPAASIVLALILVVLGSSVLYGYWLSLSNLLKGGKTYSADARQEQPLWDWVCSHTQPADVLLAYRDPVVYLHTGRHTARSIVLPRPGFYSTGPLSDRLDASLFSTGFGTTKPII